ncbi:hypothetical protein NX059_006598 [Plenodomus lindquistii]|nr:hypothetical protein NX059_006598 [Plenodomus lindquistii]
MEKTDTSEHREVANTMGSDTAEELQIRIHARTFIAIFAVCASSFAQLAALVGSGLLGRPMSATLGAPNLAAWFPSIIAMLTLVAILPISQAADLWGRKPFILLCNASGVVGSIIVSRSQNIATGIAGFCFIGSAFGCQALLYTIPSEVLPRKYRAYGQSAVNLSSGLAAVVGILVGSSLIRNNPDNWRPYWYMILGLFAAGTGGTFFGYNPPKRELEESMTLQQKLGKVDWIGSFLIAAGMLLLVIALNYSDNPYSWSDGHVLGPFVSGLVLTIAFGLYEWKGTSEGLLHHALFQKRTFPIVTVIVFLEGAAFFTVNSYFVFQIIVTHHVDAFDAGLRFMLLFLASTVAAIFAGWWTTQFKQVREPLVAGYILLVAFCVAMHFYDVDVNKNSSYGFAVIGAFGIGFILPTVIVAAHMDTPAEHISLSSGLPTAARSLGAAVGLAINNAIFSNSMSTNIPKKIAEAVLPLGFNPRFLGPLIGGIAAHNDAALAAIPGITPQIIGAGNEGYVEAHVVSFAKVWIAAAVLSAVGAIGALVLPNPKDQFTNHIDAPVEAELVAAQRQLEAKAGFTAA